jgi:hypothetical protein
MALVLRPAGYTGTLQQITWNQGNNVPATAYLWGGGGGAGGSGYTGLDNGGAGGGGQFSQVNFTVSDGDVLEVAVGGPGQGGENFTNNAAGGSPGASLLVNEIFNTRTATPISGPGGALFPQFNSRYCTFLNVNGVWINPSSAGIFDKTYTVTFPVTGNYQFQASADNSAKFYFDGVEVFTAFDYGTTYEVGYPVDAGTHTLRIVGTNTGGPGAVALTITTGSSYSGGRGGNSGSYGILTRVGGAGGGGGGATVLLKNGEVIGVAGGGGAGSGAGGGSGSRQDAPGTVGQAAPGQNSGQNGTTPINYWLIWNRGGGGGGGGGGLGGGNGGYTNSEILSVGAGSYGGGFGAVSNPVGRLPGGTTNQYWIPTVGYGGRQRAFGPGETGNGVGGYAMLAFDVSGIWVNESGQGWKQTRDVFAKANNTWNEVKGVWIKEAGVWEPVISSYAPNWTAISGRYGINPRAAAPDLTPAPPPEPAGGYETGGFDGGGGGGGGKVICTALYQMGMMPEELYDHDQRFGKWLYENDPVAYKGYRKWADVLVKYMNGQGQPLLPSLLFWKTPEQKQEISRQIAVRVGNFVGYSFAAEIARRAGQDVPFSIGGWIIVSVGLKVCKAIGYAYGLHKKSRKKK